MSLTETKQIRWRPLLFELFVAVSLAVSYFYLVRNFFAWGDPMNFNVFTAGSEKLFRLHQPFMGTGWDARLSGLLLTGALTDSSLIASSGAAAQLHHLINVFGIYHSCWLFLLFVCIIFTLRNSLFVILGIFAGLMYDFSPTSGLFYPWDMPVTFFFTLAVLFFERRNIWMMAVAICAGSFFKETALVPALLILFAEPWKWTRRVLLFAGLFVVYFLGKHWLVAGLGLAAPKFSPGQALRLHGAFSPSTLFYNVVENFKDLLSWNLNSVIFVNAGTLIAVLALGWRKRLLPYMIVIVAFIAGLFLFSPPPGLHEIRAFVEVLPLSVMLLSVIWAEHIYVASGSEPGAISVGLGPIRPTSSVLPPIVIAVIALTTSVVTLQYYILFQDVRPGHQSQSNLGEFVYKGGKIGALEAQARLFQTGYTDTALKLGIDYQLQHRDREAEAQYERVIEINTNSVYALNNLATLLATDSNPRLRDGDRAVELARRACELTGYHEPAIIYTLAAAEAEAGRFTDAIAAASQARTLALRRGQADLVAENDPLLNLYKSGHPFHQQPRP